MGSNKVYTYVLKDLVEDLYKIGRTTQPQKRFAKLCELGKVEPLMLIEGDIEKQLHKQFADVRTNHPDTGKAGFTEYFKTGGVLGKFVERNVGGEVPFISPAYIAKTMRAEKNMRIMDMGSLWKIDNSRYGNYRLGLGVLHILGLIEYEQYGVRVLAPGVSYMDGKVVVTKSVFDMCFNVGAVRVTDEPYATGYSSYAVVIEDASVYLNIK